MSTAELNEQFNNYIIIDVRSRFEFEVIHVAKAEHASIAKMTFANDLLKITGNNKQKAIAFYCNGITCAKSYKAAVKADKLGYTNSRVYDSGIFEWTQAYPSKSVLLGKSPVDPSKLIPKSELKKKMIEKDEFAKRSNGPDAVLFDLRDPMQRIKNPVFPQKAIRIDMDKFVKNLENQQFLKTIENKEMYIFDAVGKQVGWLQYYLEEKNIKNYTFLQGGAWSFFGAKGASN
ncbi:hypothetical protein KKI24_23395 [bacterium]|nr:hypothetical protein [bacterium]